jgi:hypothetical protein
VTRSTLRSRLKSGLHLHAWSKPDGSSPSSSFFEDGGIVIGTFTGRVTCLAVQGDRAAVGGVGTFTDPSGSKQAQTDLVTLARDGSGDYTVGRVLTPGTTPPNCTAASFANQFTPFVASVLIQSG